MKKSIIEVFEESVRKDPEGIAVVEENRKITRKDLLKLVNSYTSLFPADTKRVGIIMDHSVEMIAAILAVLKIGAAYIPIEPGFPEARIEFILSDSNAEIVVTDNKKLPSDLKVPVIDITSSELETYDIPEREANPDDLAYILYTSGSTGLPKGVSVLNRNVTNYIEAFSQEFHPTNEDTILQYSVCTFDIFVEEVFSALLSGMTLAIPPKDVRDNHEKLHNFIEENNVTIISGFPYLLEDFNESNELPESVRLLISGGDILREEYVTNLIDKTEIYNTYGPSETTVCATYFRCNGAEATSEGVYPIGKAIKNVNVSILKENLEPAGIGEIGEIVIGGEGVSAGYFGDRRKENEAFSGSGENRVFHSGDLGYMLPDGNIVFTDRKDTQVMIDGRRVEPKEVENIISRSENVRKAAVTSILSDRKRPKLIAFVVFREKETIDLLREEISHFLPDYMIPSLIYMVDDLPLTPNGKVDLNQLIEETRWR